MCCFWVKMVILKCLFRTHNYGHWESFSAFVLKASIMYNKVMIPRMWTWLCNTCLKTTKGPTALDDNGHEMSIMTKGSIFKLLNPFYWYQIYFNVVLLSPHLRNRNMLVRPTSSLHRQPWMHPICWCYLYPSICFFDTTTEILAENYICSKFCQPPGYFYH